MTEEEKKAIERINKTYDDNTGYYEAKGKDWIIINKLIIKLQKENAEKDKQIDLMAKFIRTNISYDKIIYEICINGKCNNEECHEDDLKECIKQYFKEQSKKEGEN